MSLERKKTATQLPPIPSKLLSAYGKPNTKPKRPDDNILTKALSYSKRTGKVQLKSIKTSEYCAPTEDSYSLDGKSLYSMNDISIASAYTNTSRKSNSLAALLYKIGHAIVDDKRIVLQRGVEIILTVTEALSFFIHDLELKVSSAEIHLLCQKFSISGDGSSLDMVAILGQAKAAYQKLSKRSNLSRKLKDEQAQWMQKKLYHIRKLKAHDEAKRKSQSGDALQDVKRKIAEVQSQLSKIRGSSPSNAMRRGRPSPQDKSFTHISTLPVDSTPSKLIQTKAPKQESFSSNSSIDNHTPKLLSAIIENDASTHAQEDDTNILSPLNQIFSSSSSTSSTLVDSSTSTRRSPLAERRRSISETGIDSKRSSRRNSRRDSVLTSHDLMMIDVYNYYTILYPTRQEALKFVYEDY